MVPAFSWVEDFNSYSWSFMEGWEKRVRKQSKQEEGEVSVVIGKGLAVRQGMGRDGQNSKQDKQDFVPSFSSEYMLVLPDGWCRLWGNKSWEPYLLEEAKSHHCLLQYGLKFSVFWWAFLDFHLTSSILLLPLVAQSTLARSFSPNIKLLLHSLLGLWLTCLTVSGLWVLVTISLYEANWC